MKISRLQHKIPLVLLLAGLTLLAACSSNQRAKKNESGVDSLGHDPYSAPMYVASMKTPAPNFKAQLLTGKLFRLANQQGKIVLINIWATWCPPCKEETPELADLYKKYHPKGVQFLGVSVDKQGKSVVQPFVKKYKVPYPITIDDGTILKKYGPVMGYPTTYLIDQQGDLRYFATGAITQKELKPRLDKLLAERNNQPS